MITLSRVSVYCISPFLTCFPEVTEAWKRPRVMVPKEFHPLREEDDNNDLGAAFRREKTERMPRHLWERIKFRRQQEEGPVTPTLLTWAAREQLLYLHRTDPNTWTAHRLSTAFPVSIVDIRRTLRKHRNPPITPASTEFIAEYDKQVAERWKALKSGRGGDIVTEEQREAYAAGTLVLGSPSGVQPSLPGHSLAPLVIVIPPPPLGPVGRLLTTYVQREEAKKLAKLNENVNQSDSPNRANQLTTVGKKKGTALMTNARVGGTGRSVGAVSGVGTSLTHGTVSNGAEVSGIFSTADSSGAQYDYEPQIPGVDRVYPDEGRRGESLYGGAEVVFEKDGEDGEDDEMDMRLRTSGERINPSGKVSHEVAKERLLARLDKPDQHGNKSTMGEAYRKWFTESEQAAKPGILTRLQTMASQKENEMTVARQPTMWKGTEEVTGSSSQVPRYKSLRRQMKDSRQERVNVTQGQQEPDEITVGKDERPFSTVYRQGNSFYGQDGSFLYKLPS